MVLQFLSNCYCVGSVSKVYYETLVSLGIKYWVMAKVLGRHMTTLQSLVSLGLGFRAEVSGGYITKQQCCRPRNYERLLDMSYTLNSSYPPFYTRSLNRSSYYLAITWDVAYPAPFYP